MNYDKIAQLGYCMVLIGYCMTIFTYVGLKHDQNLRKTGYQVVVTFINNKPKCVLLL